jgi:hypothetical protein
MNLCSCKRRRRKIFLKLIPKLAEQRNGGMKGTPSRIQSRCSQEKIGDVFVEKERSLLTFTTGFMACSWTRGRECMEGMNV